MAISFIGSASAAGTTVAIPAHQAGDFIIVFANKDGTNTIDTMSSPWNIGGQNGSSVAGDTSNWHWQIAVDGSTVAPSIADATEIAVMVYRGVNASDPIGHFLGNSATGGEPTFLALTLEESGGSSWILAFAGHRFADTDMLDVGGAITTNRENISSAVVTKDSNGGVSSAGTWSTSGVTAGIRWCSWQIELKADVSPTATGAVNLSQLSAASDGQVHPNANGVTLLQQLVALADGVMLPDASGTPLLTQLVALATGEIPIESTGAPTLPQLTALGASTIEGIFGDGTPTLPQLTSSAQGANEQSASGAATLQQIRMQTGNAFHGGANAEGAPTLSMLVVSAGVAEFAAVGGDAQIFLPALEALGSSGQLFTASGAVTLALLRATGKASPYIPVYRAVGIVFPKSNPYGIFVHEPWWPYKRIADLTVWASNIDRTYERMQAGVASLNLPTQLSDNHSIHQGNILVIISRDQPTWAGTILIHDDALGTGQITIFARELSNILDKRTAPQAERYNFGIGSTYYFRSLINKMNARGFTGIELATGLEPGPTLYDIFAGGQTVFQDLEEIHNRTNWEWWMEYEAAPGYLRSRIKWGYKQGVDLSATHHLWHPINFKSISLRHDVSEGKQVTTSIGGFGRPVWERTAVTREANYGPQRLDIGGTIELAPELVVRTVAELPAGLRDERVQLEVTTESPNELSRRAQREQERRLAGETQIRMTVVGLSDRTMLQVGNYITIHAPVGHHGELDGAVRIVGVQPDEELGETDVIAEVRV